MKIRKRVVVGAVIAITLVSYLVIKDKFLYSKNTKLYSGIEQNNVKLIDEALEEGCDINESDYINNGESKPIFRAINNNNENNREIVKYLIEKGVDANSCREDGTSILMIMAEDNNDDLCNLLLDKGANIKYGDDKGYTAAFGEVETIKLLQEKDLSLNICDNYGMSVLSIASKYGNNDVVKYLLDQGVDVNGGEGYVPPVVMAAKNNHYDVVKYLIEKDANLVPSSDFYNVLYEAANNGNIQMVDLILKSGYPLDDNYLFSTDKRVIENNNTSVLQYLLDNGYGLKIKKDGQSLLEYADDYYVAKVLVEGGLDINEYNKSAKDLKMLEYLFDNGASPNRILENAITYGNMDILNLTIKNNVDMNYIDETSLSKDSPLIMAAYSGSKSIMQKVIKNGADINYKNAEGATALMKVSNEGWTECAKLLVDAGADKNIKDNDDKKAVDYAKDSSIKKIVK